MLWYVLTVEVAEFNRMHVIPQIIITYTLVTAAHSIPVIHLICSSHEIHPIYRYSSLKASQTI